MKRKSRTQDSSHGAPAKSSLLRKMVIAGIILAAAASTLAAGALIYNNVSLWTDRNFAKRLDAAIEKGRTWTETHRDTILKRKNIALIKMLKELEHLRATPVFSDIISGFLAAPSRPRCWKRLVDPNWPIDEIELNIAIGKEILDNKWVLYAIAPQKANVTPAQLHLFDPNRWQGRKLTHQLDALLMLRNTQGPSEKVDNLIAQLCDRIAGELVFDAAIVDIYIQKVTFVLRAGFPEKIRRRWVERIIDNQRPDGGWNDRWLCFTSRRRPTFAPAVPPSDQHATIQALTALYIVRYRYPQHFGLSSSRDR